jgi:tetraacyldisaccharide 4'-kinase
MSLALALQASWYGQGKPPRWTAPLAWLYGWLSGWRRLCYRRGWLRSIRLSVPVLVVGNISVGGTGKTPLTIALAAELRQRGWRPGVVSRGYGGTEKGPALLDAHPDPARYGDEPCLIHASGVPVAVGRDRPAAAALLVEQGCDVLIADDGLQHYRLARDLEICVIDGERRFGNGRLLPAGPLREPLDRLDRVHWRVCNGGVPAVGEVAMSLQGDALRQLQGNARQPLAALRGQAVNAVAAIGHPQRFFDSLAAQGLLPQGHAFADHHAYASEDFAFDDGRPLLMTEKDAIKCQALAKPHWWSVPVQAHLPAAFYQEVDRQLRQLARRD